MSILNVEHLTHGFGDRAIFEDVSFRLLKGEHIGLVGANGEGKSTFMSIVTGKLQPDEGTIEWARHVTAGYLDEPTNHLDVDAKEELKRALKEYKGSILMVCHEPDFYQDIVTEEWDCTKWTTKVF
jgi:ATPase subunit of ABC transporter with duplicated ATPase domains